MGLLDSVVGGMLGGGSGGGNSQLLQIIMGMLGNQGGGAGAGMGGLGGMGSSGGLGGMGSSGGLGGLLQQFQRSGLGDVAASWVSTGPNQPVSGEQLQGVFGNDMVAQIAQQLGLSQGDTLGQLSQMLPTVVDKLTPNGELPAGNPDMGQLGDLMGSLLKR
jgi:uncharacterized protein YidB (DUF937 family)